VLVSCGGGWLHTMQYRHEAVFNIGRPRPILDLHAQVFSEYSCYSWFLPCKEKCLTPLCKLIGVGYTVRVILSISSVCCCERHNYRTLHHNLLRPCLHSNCLFRIVNSCTQCCAAAHNAAQLHTMLRSCTQCCTAAHNAARNAAQLHTMLHTMLHTILHSCTQYCTAAPNTAQLHAILHSCTQCCTQRCTAAHNAAQLHTMHFGSAFPIVSTS
jgi:hypothetical protein